MSTLFNDSCSICKNILPGKGSGNMGRCNAFPNGIPGEHWLNRDVRNLDECANGYKYEYDEEKDLLK